MRVFLVGEGLLKSILKTITIFVMKERESVQTQCDSSNHHPLSIFMFITSNEWLMLELFDGCFVCLDSLSKIGVNTGRKS